MLICVPEVLSKADVADFRRIMDGCDWEDGRSTAGAQSALVKNNEQLPPDSEVARTLGNRVISALTASPTLHLGGDPAADLSAAVQPLYGLRRAPFRHPCRQRGEGRPADRPAHPHRPLGHVVFVGTGGV